MANVAPGEARLCCKQRRMCAMSIIVGGKHHYPLVGVPDVTRPMTTFQKGRLPRAVGGSAESDSLQHRIYIADYLPGSLGGPHYLGNDVRPRKRKEFECVILGHVRTNLGYVPKRWACGECRRDRNSVITYACGLHGYGLVDLVHVIRARAL